MADEIRQQLGLDASDALQSLKQLDAALASLEARSKATAAALGQFTNTGKGFKSMGSQGVQAFNQLGQAGQRNAKTIKSAFDQLISVNGRFSTSLGLLSRIVFTQAVVSGFRNIRSAIQDSIGASIDFQKQIALIRSIDDTKVFGGDLGNQLRDLSNRFNIKLPEVGAATYEALSAQVIKTADDFKFLEASAALARSGFASMDDSVKLLSGTMTAFGKNTSEADRLSSIFFATARDGNITVSQLAEQFGTVAPLGKQLGVSVEELAAAFATLTNRGLNPAAAATAIRGNLTGLIKPSKELAKVLREMGFENVEQGIQALGSWGKLLKAIQDRTDGTAQATAEYFHNIRGLIGQLQLGAQGFQQFNDQFERNKGLSKDLAKQKAGEVMATDAEKFTKKLNQLGNDLIPVGDASITLFNKVSGATRSAVEIMGTGLATIADKITGVGVNADETRARYERLAEVLGKDLSRSAVNFDPFTGQGAEIKSLTDIVTRQLEVVNKRRQEFNEDLLSQQAQTQREFNELKLQEFGDLKVRNSEMLAEVKGASNAILAEERARNTELAKIISERRGILKDAPNRIQALTQARDQKRFESQNKGLPGGQQALGQMQRADSLMSQSQTKFESFLRTGDISLLEQSRTLAQLAKSENERAAATAASAGARDRELQAMRQGEQIANQTIALEERAAKFAAASIPTLEKQKAERQQSLSVIQQAVNTLQKNSSLLDKDGNQLSTQQLEAQAKNRAAAMQTLLDQGVSKDKVIDLQFRTDGAIQKLQTDLTNAVTRIMNGLSASAGPAQSLSTSIGNLQGPMQGNASAAERMASALERSATASQQIKMPQAAANAAFGGRMGYFAAGGRGIDTIPAFLSPGEMVINSRQTGRFFSQLQAMNAGMTPAFRGGGGTVNNVTNIGDVNIRTNDSKVSGREIIRAIRNEIRRGNGKI